MLVPMLSIEYKSLGLKVMNELGYH